ncbi:tumor necrosis factor receptor superfamily member 5 isoform X2 [Lepisosteus oculatus]|uniref:tumor necrosis factor receptor superfamily member 5 isoform X2 n=1 Tax=Lepisosteus oculatus TaxID=7918 RepID=UPI00371AF682
MNSTEITCPVGEYKDKEKCCKKCPKGQHVNRLCVDSLSLTHCSQCQEGTFMDNENYLYKCINCKHCDTNNHQITVSKCSADRNTQCECVSGYYCEDISCEHCLPWMICKPGEGARIPATPRNNAFCDSCPPGTYNNVTDSHTPCLQHTNCTVLGKVLKTAGTNISDSICGPYQCPNSSGWLLPASLWAGFTLFVVVFFVFLGFRSWRNKRQTIFTVAKSADPEVKLIIPPVIPLSDQKLPVLSPDSPKTLICEPELTGLCPGIPSETCDPSVIFDIEEDGVMLPTLTATERFDQSAIKDTGTGNGFSAPMYYSEPQEDEWTDLY